MKAVENGMLVKDSINFVYNCIMDGGTPDMADIMDISDSYEAYLEEESRKKTGRFYTERSIIRYMLENVLDHVDLSFNPYIRILDPACGCGYFLMEAYDMLYERYSRDMDSINRRSPGLNLSIENMHDHIISRNLSGADMDEYGVKLAITGLMLKNPKSRKIPDILCCDSIMNWEDTYLKEKDFWDRKFDIIIGNPPYIGHKKTDMAYRKTLCGIYGKIFKDKADISYCFIKSSIDRLAPGGRLSFITSRYFMESPSGRALREYISANCTIEKIVDFYGIRIMKGISVDPVIFFFTKSSTDAGNTISVIKAQKGLKKLDGEGIFREINNTSCANFKFFEILQRELDTDGWILCDDEELSIIRKIEKNLKLQLSDVCESFQGIITGCDKAFIVDEETIKRYGIERDIIRPWIKSSFIGKYRTCGAGLYIIYSDLINTADGYKNALSYIGRHRERLEKRRECKNGVRKWYELQWGRQSGLFENGKIVFPYKSSQNRFAFDRGNYASADVYGMHIKDKSGDITYPFLLGILNSRLYEFYFKSYAKKLGENLYDYYPNTVMRLKVPGCDIMGIGEAVSKILESDDSVDNSVIDDMVYKLFNITKSERQIIEGRLSRL